jgi:hypothetical protein
LLISLPEEKNFRNSHTHSYSKPAYHQSFLWGNLILTGLGHTKFHNRLCRDLYRCGGLPPGITPPSAGVSGLNIGRGRDMIFFFSHRIGLSDEGKAIPILGGTRLTGRAANWELGVLNMQQEEFEDNLATNFTVGWLRRNLLANSDGGSILLHLVYANDHIGIVWKHRLRKSQSAQEYGVVEPVVGSVGRGLQNQSRTGHRNLRHCHNQIKP